MPNMPIIPIIPKGALVRKEDSDVASVESVYDILFKVAGVALALATLGVAYIHYRRHL